MFAPPAGKGRFARAGTTRHMSLVDRRKSESGRRFEHGKLRRASTFKIADNSTNDGVQGLSRAAVESFRQAFTMFDKDGDGFITIVELGTVMRALGVYPTQVELDDMMEKADADGNGFIEESEFIDLMWQRSKDVTDRQMATEAFTIFDRDQSGYMTEDEIQIALQAFGVHLSDEEISTVMQEWDTNGDGVLDVEEFVDMASQLEHEEEEVRLERERNRERSTGTRTTVRAPLRRTSQ